MSNPETDETIEVAATDVTDTTKPVPVVPAIEPVKPVESPVRNPEGLLNAYEAQKKEIADLKAFKLKRESELSAIEQDRLKKEQQFEALIPLKIEEALKPYAEKLTAYEIDKVSLTAKLSEAETKYEDLKNSLKLSSDKEALYAEFLVQKGDNSTSKDALWKLYGSEVKQDKDGQPIELTELVKTIALDSFGSKLFSLPALSGTGTPPQKSTAAKEATDKPRSVTQAMLLNPRKHSIKTEDIMSGKIVVEG